MKKIYEYLYYRYRIYMWKKKDVPEWTASFAISLLVFLKLLILFMLFDIINVYFLNNFDLIFKITKSISVGLMGLLMITTYFWFIHKKRYLKIINRYKDETEKQKSIRGLLIFLYIILTFVIIFFLAYIGKHGRM
ncbi:MAG: hypothetical protein GXO80_03045 [Chlorobi bacterium]|nr:hypothetical protein [Chlorobiota bacterium]